MHVSGSLLRRKEFFQSDGSSTASWRRQPVTRALGQRRFQAIQVLLQNTNVETWQDAAIQKGVSRALSIFCHLPRTLKFGRLARCTAAFESANCDSVPSSTLDPCCFTLETKTLRWCVLVALYGACTANQVNDSQEL